MSEMPVCTSVTQLPSANSSMWDAHTGCFVLFQFPRLTSSTAAKLQDLIQSGVKKHDAWNQCTVQLAQAAKVSKIYLLI